eukprot:4635840-Ditylum_brightwellii.AAC.1
MAWMQRSKLLTGTLHSCDAVIDSGSFLQGATHTSISALAEYMIHWSSMPWNMQLELLHTWIKVAEFVQGFGVANIGGGG